MSYTCAAPPSTNSSVPVTKLLSSEARKTAALSNFVGRAEAGHRHPAHDALQHLLARWPGLRQCGRRRECWSDPD